MFRYKLRTLLIVLALGPPILGWSIWPAVNQLTGFNDEVRLGMSRSEVRATLGPPNALSQDHWVYWGERRACSFRISVEFEGDVVQSVGSAEEFHD